MRFGIVGNAHAGKTTVANMIEKIYAGSTRNRLVHYYKFADPLYKILDAIGQDKNRKFMQEVSDVIKKYFGDDIFVRLCDNDIIRTHKDDLILVDDVRYVSEFNMLKDNNFVLIGVYTDISVRKARAKKLNIEFNDSHSSEQFVDELIENCDHIIENTGDSKEDLVQLESIVKKIVSEYQAVI